MFNRIICIHKHNIPSFALAKNKEPKIAIKMKAKGVRGAPTSLDIKVPNRFK